MRRAADHILSRASLSGRHGLVRWLFLRALGIVYFTAFRSLGKQVLALYGRRGILPVADLLEHARKLPAPERSRLFPTVFWLDDPDATLVHACRAAEVLSVGLMLSIAPRVTSALLWSLYLSPTSLQAWRSTSRAAVGRATLRRTGNWWHRKELGLYFPPVSLASAPMENPTVSSHDVSKRSPTARV